MPTSSPFISPNVLICVCTDWEHTPWLCARHIHTLWLWKLFPQEHAPRGMVCGVGGVGGVGGYGMWVCEEWMVWSGVGGYGVCVWGVDGVVWCGRVWCVGVWGVGGKLQKNKQFVICTVLLAATYVCTYRRWGPRNVLMRSHASPQCLIDLQRWSPYILAKPSPPNLTSGYVHCTSFIYTQRNYHVYCRLIKFNSHN